MALLKQLRLLLTIGSLVVSAATTRRTNDDDDDNDTPLPLVIWHGLGDNYRAEGIQAVVELAEQANPGTFVYLVHIEDDASADRSATFFGNVTTQLAKVCEDLAAHPILSTAPAIDALGFSQGGQFLRGYVERCNNPPVRSLVTYGSQHNGISSFKSCGSTDWLCKGAMALLRFNTWSSYVQSRLVPAQYYRDPASPADYEKYLESSNFLADINNERGGPRDRNPLYRANIARLVNFAMYIFEDDTTVVPKESGWFEEVNGTEITPLRARKIYTEDWLGLRELDRKGGLKFRSVPGEHMRLSDSALNETFQEFFGPYGKKFDTPSSYVGDDEL